ncbi:MAG: TonB-dependent receptor domain-containing protein [bacterium]
MKRITCNLILSLFIAGSNFAQDANKEEVLDTASLKTLNIEDDINFQRNRDKITSENFDKFAFSSPNLLIQDRIPGFVINNLNSNSPIVNLEFQNRGASTLYLNTNPIYILDGVPVESIDYLSIEGIESIRVLKRVSELAQYGILGSNGVIIIETKQNELDNFHLAVSSYGYMETFAKPSDYMTSREWNKLKQDWESSPYVLLRKMSGEMVNFKSNTDWRKEISQQKISHLHNLHISGVKNKTRYSTNFYYDKLNGIIQKTGRNNIGSQLSISQLALKNKLKLDISSFLNKKQINNIIYNPLINISKHNEYSNILSNADLYNPTVPVYLDNGSFGQDTVDGYHNPLQKLQNTIDDRRKTYFIVNFKANYELLKGLKFSGKYSYQWIDVKSNFLYDHMEDTSYLLLGKILDTYNGKRNWLSSGLNYSKTLGHHYIDLGISFSGSVIKNEAEHYDSLFMNPGYYKFSHISVISKIAFSTNYTFQNKYFLSTGIIREKSPFYKPRGSKEYFPYLSVGWIISREKFLNHFKWLNQMTLFLDAGVSKRSYSSPHFENLLNTEFDRLFTNIVPNYDLHGENISEISLGTSIKLFSNRLIFSLDYYRRQIIECITKTWMDVTLANPELRILNNASIYNKGWEFNLEGQPLITSFRWSISANLSFNKNKLLYNFDPLEKSVGDINMVRFAGYSKAGEMLFINEKGDTTTHYGDRVKVGNGIPKSFFGLMNTFYYRNFKLSIFVKGALGFKIRNYRKINYSSGNYPKTITLVDQRDIINSYVLNETDYIIENGDYIKLDNISLGYTIPFEKGMFNKVQLFIASKNIAILSKFNGQDPGKVSILPRYAGSYFMDNYPLTRIFMIGVKLEL